MIIFYDKKYNFFTWKAYIFQKLKHELYLFYIIWNLPLWWKMSFLYRKTHFVPMFEQYTIVMQS